MKLEDFIDTQEANLTLWRETMGEYGQELLAKAQAERDQNKRQVVYDCLELFGDYLLKVHDNYKTADD